MPFAIERVDAWARFETFVEEEHERLYKALYFVSGSREDAEDLAQDAFMKLWERWDRIDEIDDPTGYLFRIALNAFRMGGVARRSRSDGTFLRPTHVTTSSTRRCGPTCGGC